MELNPRLLESLALTECPVDLNACLNARGLYNSVQCVLRLSPEVHRRIATLPDGIVDSNGVDFEDLQAYSTYLHETVHWWQYVGSTTGLMLSLSYPAQAHTNHAHLKRLLRAIGAKKSILQWIGQQRASGGPETPPGTANIIVNNHFDIEFFRILGTNPQLVRQVVAPKLFESIGHSYSVAYGNVLLILAETIGDEFAVIPDPRTWENEFAALRNRNVTGHYYGSPVRVSPVGAYQIFEAQARFAQLHYLFFASGKKLGWEHVRARGMLNGVYGEAFSRFLELAHLDWPPSIDHPTVALFMLICDVAINPGACFPFPLQFPASFIEDVDPGLRFLFLCRAVATKHPSLATRITEYSRDEYLEVTEALARSLVIDSPTAIAHTVASWRLDSEQVKSIMAEHSTFAYSPSNLPVRLLFSHFVDFCTSKADRPEFFCRPGAWMTGQRAFLESRSLFEHHSAPFIDKADDAGIYPRLMPHRSASVVYTAFSNFYAMNATYELKEAVDRQIRAV